MTQKIQRHHWLNTIVGLLDSAFYLSDEEQFLVTGIINKMLIELKIPERKVALELPPPVALEYRASFYTDLLAGPRKNGRVRHVREVVKSDIVVAPDSWQQAFLDMILVSYPDLDPYERIFAAKTLNDLLLAIGVPTRAASFYPEFVIQTYLQSPDATWTQSL